MPDPREKTLLEAFRASRDSVRNRSSLIIFLTGCAILIVCILTRNPSHGLVSFVACATVAWLARKHQI
jgi:hypothetical protein